MHQAPEEAVSTSCTAQPRISDTESSNSVRYSKQSTSTVILDRLNYKPISLRWPALASLFFLACSLLGLLEYARHLLPMTRDLGGISQALVLSSPATILSSPVQPVVTGAPTTIIRRQGTVSKKPPLSYPMVTPLRYAISNKTTLQTINGTGLPTNSAKPETSSILGVNSTTGGLVCRSCTFMEPSNYADATAGPIVHIAFLCGSEPGPRNAVPFWADDYGKVPSDDCRIRWWSTSNPLDCPFQMYNLGKDYQERSIPYNPKDVTSDGDWFPVLIDSSLIPDISRCDQPVDRCWLACGTPRKQITITGTIETLRLLDQVTSTSQIEGFETTITSVLTGKDGNPTTLIQSTTVSASVSTFTTSQAVFITATRKPGEEVWAQIYSATMGISPGQDGLPPGITNHPIVTTLRNRLGTPTATVTNYLETLLDSNTSPTATVTVSLETLTDSNGVPTKTLAENAATETGPYFTSNNNEAINFVSVNRTRYFIGSFLPVLIAVLLSILIQLVDKNLKLMLPFYALTTRRNGASAADSLCMIPGGLIHLPRSVRLLYRFGEPLSLLSDILVLVSAVLVSVASEVVELKLYGMCKPDSYRGCYMGLVVLDAPSRVGEVLLVLMAMTAALIWGFLCMARSGVAGNPWSIATSGSLLSEEAGKVLQSIRLHDKEIYIHNSQILRELEGKSFSLQHYRGSQGKLNYGIAVRNNRDSSNSNKSPPEAERIDSIQPSIRSKRTPKKLLNSFQKQRVWDHGVRASLLAILIGLLTLILYYDTKQMDPSTNRLERFMDSQKFGVRFLFSAVGVIITLFWDSIFSHMVMVQPYRYLSGLNLYTKASLSVSPATTVFPALWRAVLQRDPFAFTIAFAGTLSKFTPLLLSNIPYRVTQTWRTHVVCAWMTVSILGLMILVLIWSFFVKWPYMPVDPSTIAGNMYYLCDSEILDDFKGMSKMDEKEMDTHMNQAGTKYRFGKMTGRSGDSRIGISHDREERI